MTVPRPLLLAVALLATSFHLRASDLVVPVGGNWRGTQSVLVVSNVSNAPADIEVSFIPAGNGVVPATLHLRKGPSETEEIDVAQRVLHGQESVGALRIRSANAIEATLRLFDVNAVDRAGTFESLRVSDAIANGERTTITGPAIGDNGLRLFVAETRGFPLYFSATFRTASGRVMGSRRYYVGGSRQSTHSIDADMPVDRSEPFTIEIDGLNGSGRIVAAAATVAPDKGITAWDMSRRRGVRHKLTGAEVLGYAIVGGFVGVVALYTRKKSEASRA